MGRFRRRNRQGRAQPHFGLRPALSVGTSDRRDWKSVLWWTFTGGANGQEDQGCCTEPKASAKSIRARVCGTACAASHRGVEQRETDPQEKAGCWENAAPQRQLKVAIISAPTPTTGYCRKLRLPYARVHGPSRSTASNCNRNPQEHQQPAERDTPRTPLVVGRSAAATSGSDDIQGQARQ
jgi:hypothetical protein